MKTVFENEIIKVSKTGRDYDFIAVIENKRDKEIEIVFDDIDLEYNGIIVNANDWVGLLADYEGYFKLEELEAERFTVI